MNLLTPDRSPLPSRRSVLVAIAIVLGHVCSSAQADPPGARRASYSTEAGPSGRGNDAETIHAEGPPRRLADADARPLPPQSAARGGDGEKANGERPFRPASGFMTGLTSLAIVLGLFFVAAWAVRRGLPQGPTALPSDVVEVLGRTPLAARQFAHLVRCGNKLLLVHVSPGCAETLTEITDPAEVDRLAGLCRQAHPQSTTASFRQIFQQFSREKPADSEAT